MSTQQTASSPRHELNTAQHGLWLGHTLNDDKALFNTAECIVFDGKVDEKKLEAAVRQAVAESECLSCHYRSDDQQPFRMVVNQPVPFSTVPLAVTGDEIAAVRHWASLDLSMPFIIDNELPCRFALLQGQQADYLYLCVHHIALDGFGTTLLFQRIAEVYSSLVGQQAVTDSSFGSFQPVLEEDNRRRESGAYQKAQDYWLEILAGSTRPSTYATDIAPISAKFHRETAELPELLWQQCQQQAEALNLTWADVFLAALATHLWQFNRDEKVVIGMMVMNRLGSKSLTVPCMQMNIVPLVVDIGEQDDLAAVVRKVAAHKKKMRRFQHFRYEDLRRELNRVGGEERLYGTLVNIMPFDHPLQYGNLAAETLNLSAGPVEDLTIELHCKPGGIPTIDFDANPAVYDKLRLTNLQGELLALLAEWMAAPERKTAELLKKHHAKARQQALIAGDELAIGKGVLEAIRSQAAANPNRIAVEQEGDSLSYQSLLSAAGSTAAALKQLGVKPGDKVGVALSRSIPCITTVLGVMLSGAVYVPLDPEQPFERQQAIAGLAGLRLVVTEAQYQHRLVALGLPVHLAGQLVAEVIDLPEVQDSDLAYIMFTSGSTGQPKGVELSYRALNHFVVAAAQRYGITSQDRVLQFAPYNFDASIEEIFVTLSQGATLVLRTDAMLESMSTFSDSLQQAKVTVLDLPTAFWNEWVVSLHGDTATLPDTLEKVIIGGEAVYPEPLSHWQAAVEQSRATIQLFNTYGPTEATVVATCAELQDFRGDDAQLPIGLPLPGVEALVLDSRQCPASSGELVIMGDTLAEGYIGQTHPAFSALLVGGQLRRIYRTGDRVTLSHDAHTQNANTQKANTQKANTQEANTQHGSNQQSQLIYQGRIDNEFKISGYRIQPGEVESHLLAIPGVVEACVQGVTYPSGLRRLVAFVAGDTEASSQPLPQPQTLKQSLLEHLPHAMVPSDFRLLEALPKTTSNKVDRKALLARYHQEANNQELATETENRVSAIWQQVLGVAAIGSQDNFFALGGQSLQTIQIVNRLAAEFGVSVKVSDVFDRPVLSEFCGYLDEMQQQGEDEVEMVW
ncbi:AMP-binding protein [Photobacterium rosenbergii]|uniref:AMP-binding protein n=1 Tax=Photobacterium rosenbergii TaxID=294936 RepID=A0ABU3ZMM2_9GAMM|nr:AMP-binding protein [Photobacterium rosenbergii]MDV5171352.1 AMP-binding protein [Photobacterium rosenbergii]